MTCAWVRHLAHLEVYVRIKGLTRIFSGSRATSTPGQAPLCPKRRQPQPQNPRYYPGIIFPHWCMAARQRADKRR